MTLNPEDARNAENTFAFPAFSAFKVFEHYSECT
jgi:hypothetical protein